MYTTFVFGLYDDNDKKTIAEHAFEQAVPPIAMIKINAKWKQEDDQTWENYQDFMTDELPAAFRDHGVKDQHAHMANWLTAMEASIKGI